MGLTSSSASITDSDVWPSAKAKDADGSVQSVDTTADGKTRPTTFIDDVIHTICWALQSVSEEVRFEPNQDRSILTSSTRSDSFGAGPGGRHGRGLEGMESRLAWQAVSFAFPAGFLPHDVLVVVRIRKPR